MNGSLNLLLLFFTLLTGCQLEEKTQKEFLLELDHLLIFVSNPNIENQLKNEGFIFGDKLTTSHPHQGTKGQYFIFYNTFIEFLSLEDSSSAKANEERFGSSYTQRWLSSEQKCPIGFGLTIQPFDTTQTPFLPYQSLDNPSGDPYLMSAFNVDQKQPFVYVSSPERAYQKIDSLDQLEAFIQAPALADFKTYLNHPVKIKKLSQVVFTIPKSLSRKSGEIKKGNLNLLKRVKNIKIKTGNNYGLDLIFDDKKQGKMISLEASFDFNIYY